MPDLERWLMRVLMATVMVVQTSVRLWQHSSHSREL